MHGQRVGSPVIERKATRVMDSSSTGLTAARVKRTLGRVLDLDEAESVLRDSSSLYSAEIRLDSLALLRLLVLLEEEFGIEIDDEDVMDADLDTVGSLVGLVEEAGGRGNRTRLEPDLGSI